MAIEVFSDKVELKVSAHRVWKAAFEESHVALPKASPAVIERVEYDGAHFGIGSIRTIHFHKSHVERNSKEKHPGHIVALIKEKILELNSEARTVKVAILEGGFIGVLVKSYSATFHVEASGPDSSTLHYSFEYEALSESHRPHIPIALKEAVPQSFADIEAFLLSHPEY